MPEVLVLQHVACEPLGTIENALRRAGLSHRTIRAQDGQSVPREIGAAAGLIVMGGPMGVSEEKRYPFLTEEMRLIAQALSQELPTLGVCLGGQLLAAVLGAPVHPAAKKEIGWHPVTLTPEAAGDALWNDVHSPFQGFHWHGDFFETPPMSVSLASSELTPCQVFRFGAAAYGFQFHLEVTETIIRDWTTTFARELLETGTKAAPILEGVSRHLAPMQQISQSVFGHWAAIAVPPGSK